MLEIEAFFDDFHLVVPGFSDLAVESGKWVFPIGLGFFFGLDSLFVDHVII